MTSRPEALTEIEDAQECLRRFGYGHLADALDALTPDPPTDDEWEVLAKRLADEVEYRVRSAVALHKGGHPHEAQISEGRRSIRAIAAGFRRHAPNSMTDVEVEAAAVAISRDLPDKSLWSCMVIARAALEAASNAAVTP